MRARAHNSACKSWCTSQTLRGEQITQMSSRQAKSLLSSCSLAFTAVGAACCPRLNNSGIVGSPCSPPSLWATDVLHWDDLVSTTDLQQCLQHGVAGSKAPTPRARCTRILLAWTARTETVSWQSRRSWCTCAPRFWTATAAKCLRLRRHGHLRPACSML